MSLNYTTLQTALLAQLVRSQPPFTTTDGFFDATYPEAIQYAQQRIETDLVLLADRVQNRSLQTANAVSAVDITSTGIILVESFGLYNAGFIQFEMASLDLIDNVWPSSPAATPVLNDWIQRLWCLRDDHTIIFAPAADAAYPIFLTGMIRMAPPATGTDTNYLMTVYPALYEAACMVYLSGALNRNYGAQADEPRQAISWEGQYQSLLATAKSEEIRRRGVFPDVPVPTQAARAA